MQILKRGGYFVSRKFASWPVLRVQTKRGIGWKGKGGTEKLRGLILNAVFKVQNKRGIGFKGENVAQEIKEG